MAKPQERPFQDTDELSGQNDILFGKSPKVVLLEAM